MKQSDYSRALNTALVLVNSRLTNENTKNVFVLQPKQFCYLYYSYEISLYIFKFHTVYTYYRNNRILVYAKNNS